MSDRPLPNPGTIHNLIYTPNLGYCWPRLQVTWTHSPTPKVNTASNPRVSIYFILRNTHFTFILSTFFSGEEKGLLPILENYFFSWSSGFTSNSYILQSISTLLLKENKYNRRVYLINKKKTSIRTLLYINIDTERKQYHIKISMGAYQNIFSGTGKHQNFKPIIY